MPAGRPTTSPRPPARRTRRSGRPSAARSPRTARSGATEDARLAARRRAARRERLRWPLRIGVGVAVLVALGAGAWALLHTRWFSATTIEVSGISHETAAQVIAAAGLESHPALISIDPGQAAQGVERLPWVKTATVELRWPHTVRITGTQRTPSGAVQHQGRWLLIDPEGRILESTPGRPFNQPEVVLPSVPTGTPGAFLGPQAQPASLVAGTLPTAFRSQVASVIGHRDGTVSLQLSAPVRIELGPPTELVPKYRDVASVIAGATLHPGDVLDVSVPQAPTISGP
jgi:cell division protein FtsQ